jgi:alpha-glucosidase
MSRETQAWQVHSTLTLYTDALHARKKYRLGEGSLTWIDNRREDVLAFRNGTVTVVVNMGTEPVSVLGRILLSSDERDTRYNVVWPNQCVWVD